MKNPRDFKSTVYSFSRKENKPSFRYSPGINNWLIILLDYLPLVSLPSYSYTGRRRPFRTWRKGTHGSIQSEDAAEMGVRLKFLSIRWKLFVCLHARASFILFVTLLWSSLAMADYNSAVKCIYSSQIFVSTDYCFVTFTFYRESCISIHARHKISVLTVFDCT